MSLAVEQCSAPTSNCVSNTTPDAQERCLQRQIKVSCNSCQSKCLPACTHFGQRILEIISTYYFYAHVLYFVGISVFGGVILYFTELQSKQFLDVLFMSVSSVSETGLSTINPATMTLASQITMWLLIMFSGILLISVIPPLLRMHIFNQAIDNKLIVKEEMRALRDYRALKLIVHITLMYWASVQFTSFIILALYCSFAESPRSILAKNHVNPVWFSAFHSVSAFNNAGLSLLADNLVPFANDPVILLVTSIEILLGNCLAPVALRFIVWVMHRTDRDDESLLLLLHFPRTTFTHLFGPEATVMLAIWVFTFTAVEMVVFLATDWNEQFMEAYDAGSRVLIAYFQAITTRTAGFNAVSIFSTSLPMQFVYFMFMFLSA